MSTKLLFEFKGQARDYITNHRLAGDRWWLALVGDYIEGKGFGGSKVWCYSVGLGKPPADAVHVEYIGEDRPEIRPQLQCDIGESSC
jgi:hypothetical protein